MTALLEARHVTKIFGGGLIRRRRTIALEDFSLSIDSEQPTITGVVGESGSGKTTMARLLLGLELPTQGDVLYKGKDLRRLSRTEWRAFRRDVQAIFQDPFEVYNPFYKVDHVLTIPIAKFRLANSKQENRALIEEALQAVGLRPEETLGRYPHQLSGGQRQRVMVARALLLRPKLIIADEPVSMIDASLRATVLANLRQLNKKFNISIIYITHDLTTAYQISHNLIVLYSGSVMEAGDVELVVKQPQHPYTKLLIGSIPLPDPSRRWSGEALTSVFRKQTSGGVGCKFANRCPHAFSPCFEKAPPLFQTNQHRATACYLYQDYPSIRSEEIGKVFVRRTASSTIQAEQPLVAAFQQTQDVAWQMVDDTSHTNADA
ncbi:MAG TPA: ABC transporter ATP-binding protein [Anaerolineae bacterium]|nr:ABC transporter ATP-binding protein [Anaerolineae bacterium]